MRAREKEQKRREKKDGKRKQTERNGTKWWGKPSLGYELRCCCWIIFPSHLVFPSLSLSRSGEAYEIRKMTCVCVWKIGRVQVFISRCQRDEAYRKNKIQNGKRSNGGGARGGEKRWEPKINLLFFIWSSEPIWRAYQRLDNAEPMPHERTHTHMHKQ